MSLNIKEIIACFWFIAHIKNNVSFRTAAHFFLNRSKMASLSWSNHCHLNKFQMNYVS